MKRGRGWPFALLGGAALACSLATLPGATPTATIASIVSPTFQASPPATGTRVPPTSTPLPPTATSTPLTPATPAPSPTPARPLPRVRDVAVFGASAGLIWNFVPLDEGILQLQVQADPNAFTEQPTPVTADGEGIQQVYFEVSTGGDVVYTTTESTAAYCLLGGNGPCNGLAFEDGVYKWAPGGRVVESGDYSVTITITLTDGQTRDLFAAFLVELP